MDEILLQISLKALIQNGQGEFLFLRRVRPYNGESLPRWDVPGGKLVLGETIIASLAREILEETKLIMVGEPHIFDARDYLLSTGKHTIRLTFTVQVKETSSVVLDPVEHTDYRWATAPEALAFYHDVYLTPALQSLAFVAG